MEYKTRYACTFELHGRVWTTYSGESIAEYKDGFWVTERIVFTKAEDARYWVPPAAIRYVEKERVAV